MKALIRKLIYSENGLSKFIYSIIYFRWLKRYEKKDRFVFSSNILDYLSEERVITFREEEKVSFHPPIKIETSNTPQLMAFYENRTFTLSKSQVYLFEEAYLIGAEAVGLTLDGAIISDTALDEPVVLHKCSPNLLMNPNSVQIEATKEWCISLVHIFSSNTYTNYFHWFHHIFVLQTFYFQIL